MSAAIVKQSEADKIRKEIHEIRDELRSMRSRGERKIVRLANLVATVQTKKLYKMWRDPSTRKAYTTFGSWMHAEIQESRASVYRFIGVREHLKEIPNETLEEFGSTKCFELVKVAREKPAMLPHFVKALKKNPEIPLYTLQQQVTNTLAGAHMDSGRYERFDFAVRVEEAITITKALAVMQAIEAVQNPETAAGRGIHLVSICEEYLSGNKETKVLAQLEKAGAFSKAVFEVEN